MPIYEYQCDQCGEIEEALQKISDAPLSRCRKCSGNLHKLISQSAFHLKGTGWYVTDYAGKAPNQESKASEDAPPKSSGTGESSASTPPAPAKSE
jgi:putative FmdB family regulatory protein